MDTINFLTRGSPIGLGLALSVVNPSSSSYTACYQQNGKQGKLFGQVLYPPNERSARLIYLLPADETCSPATVALLESLAENAGAHGMINLLAELDETSSILDLFRRAGFTIYGWQKIWQLPVGNNESNLDSPIWRPKREIDEIAIHNLFQALVPPLTQAADPLPARRLPGLVYYQNNELLAYIECHFGQTGILLIPLIHPEVNDVDVLLKNIISSLEKTTNRPVYLVERSYQAWLEHSLNNLGAQSSERRALMVKRLALAQRKAVPARHVLVKNRQAETSTPLINHMTQTTHHHGETHSD